MARKATKKKSAKITRKTKRKTSFSDPNIEDIYEKEITFTCPQRGLVKQKVKIKRLKSMMITNPHIIGPDEDKVEELGGEEDVALSTEGEE